MFGFRHRVGRRVAKFSRATGVLAQRLEPRRLLAGVTVTTTDDLTDGDTSNIASLIANPGPTGISLREAMTAANNTAGPDAINFNIPGAGPHTLQLNSALPVITDTLAINGYTQPGAQANTLALGSNAVIRIHLSGVSGIGVGLDIRAADCVIQGLSLTAFDDPNAFFSTAIFIQAPRAVIEGNWVGIRPDGTVSGNRRGIGSTDEGVDARIGDTNPAARNTISGNSVIGVGVLGGNTTIRNNYIGTNTDGTGAVPNGAGIAIGGTGCIVGGAGILVRNVISGNAGDGMRVRGDGHQVEGNFIGPGANGEPLGNGGDGIRILTPRTSENIPRVGSETDAFNAPVIAYNAGHGINVLQGSADLGQLSLHNNGGAGVNSPPLPGQIVLSSAVTTTTATTVSGTVSGGNAGDSVLLEFFGNTLGGEQEAFVGFETVTLDQNGQATFSIDVAACGLPFIMARGSGVTTTILGAEELFALSTSIANTRPPVIEITTTAGSGPGSIVAAFTAASVSPGPDVILFNIPGTGFVDITPTQPLIPMFALNNNVLLEGRGQGFGCVVPRTYINVNNGLGTFNGGANNTVAGVGFFNVSGRAFDAVDGNNTLLHSTIGIGAAEQPLGVSSIVSSDVARILGGVNNRILNNVIHAGRGNATIAIFGGTDHLVQYNRIGITQSGVVLGGTPTSNNRVGVVINGGTGTEVSDNTIAGMTNDAIKVGEFGQPGGTGHTIIRNSMLLNAALGIDLADNGVTPNDGPGDPDTGPNNLQNFPEPATAEQVAGGVRVTGTFVSGLNMLYSIEAFATPSTPAINIDEGARSLGTLPLATDGDGSVLFDLTFPGSAVFGERILLTATAPDGSTSEFSVSVPLNDTFHPEILNLTYTGEFAPAITCEVSEPGITGVDASDIIVESIPPGGPLEVVAAFLLDDQQTIRYILGATGRGFIPDGNYRATFQPNSIQDAAGNPGPGANREAGGNPRVIDFFIFAGDANRDRAINISDFSILAGNFNQEGYDSDGDFNYSGRVEIGDFAILAGKFNTTLPEPAGRAPAIASPLPAAARVGGLPDPTRGLFGELIDSPV